MEADIIVHVRDAAHGDTEAQKDDVLGVLRDLGLGDSVQESLIEVLNKIDLLSHQEKEVLANRAARSNIPVVPLSAVTGEGCQRLTAVIDDRITSGFNVFDVSLTLDDGASLAWLYDHGEVVDRQEDTDAIQLKVRMDDANWARFQQRKP